MINRNKDLILLQIESIGKLISEIKYDLSHSNEYSITQRFMECFNIGNIDLKIIDKMSTQDFIDKISDDRLLFELCDVLLLYSKYTKSNNLADVQKELTEILKQKGFYNFSDYIK